MLNLTVKTIVDLIILNINSLLNKYINNKSSLIDEDVKIQQI